MAKSLRKSTNALNRRLKSYDQRDQGGGQAGVVSSKIVRMQNKPGSLKPIK